MVFLPEAFDFIGESAAETLSLSQPLTGSTVCRFQALAKLHNVWLSLGGFHHKAGGGEGRRKIRSRVLFCFVTPSKRGNIRCAKVFRFCFIS